MDQQVQQEIEQQLRSQWQTICPQILDRFTQVSKADLDAARTVDDLVRRIADKAHYSDRYVETEVTSLVLAGGGQASRQPAFGGSQPLPGTTMSQGQGQGQPFGGQQG